MRPRAALAMRVMAHANEDAWVLAQGWAGVCLPAQIQIHAQNKLVLLAVDLCSAATTVGWMDPGVLHTGERLAERAHCL